ncbi:MAG: C10 family peptidase [Alistipes sp.]|nr:C10 family peptidase [Alistipes sp.]
MRKIFAIFTALLLLSCSTNHDEVVVSVKQNPTTKITKEQALKNLYGELKIIDAETRAGGEARKVKSIKSLEGAKTRSGNALDNDLLYIVEFEEGQGSAVLAADNRLEPVIAVLDSDVMTAEDFASDDMDDIGAQMASMIEDYATFASIITPIPLLPAPGHSVRDTIYRVHVHPLLTTKWGRNYPYNGLSIDEADSYDLPTNMVACAQILKYYNGPSVINNTNINWSLLSFVENKGRLLNFTSAYSEVAKLMSLLVDMDMSSYSILQSLGYDVEFVSVPEEVLLDTDGLNIIKESITEHRPVIMSATVNEMMGPYHAWVVDGCLDYTARYIRAVERIGNIETGETIVEYITQETEYNKLHCNFGEDGKFDGYYTYRIFNLGIPNYDIDESVGDKTHCIADYADEYSYYYHHNVSITLIEE